MPWKRRFTIADPDALYNYTINDAIGNRNETSFSDFSYRDHSVGATMLGHLIAGYYHVHSPAVCYPH